MTPDEFWDNIRATRRRDAEEHAERLITRLAKRPADDIVAFGRVWAGLHAAAYTSALWGAAYLMNGGCSDDGFIDFRSWLLLQGREVFEAAVADPDSLAAARWEPDEAFCECYPAPDAYAAATGTDHDRYYEAREAAGPVDRDDESTLGESWDFGDDAEMKRRYPKLFARCTAE